MVKGALRALADEPPNVSGLELPCSCEVHVVTEGPVCSAPGSDSGTELPNCCRAGGLWLLVLGRKGTRACLFGCFPRKSDSLYLQGQLLAAGNQNAHIVQSQRGLLVPQCVCASEHGEFWSACCVCPKTALQQPLAPAAASTDPSSPLRSCSPKDTQRWAAWKLDPVS